jgi:hypothetical protein
MAEEQNLSHVIETLEESAEKGPRKITLGKVVHTLKKKGFAALLILPALIAVSPIGATPGVPFVCALLICLVAFQILFGREEIWLPERLKNISFSRTGLKKAVEVAKPYAEKIDGISKSRFSFMHGKMPQRLVALVCIVLCLPMAIIGFIPFLPASLALPILLLSLGMLVKDGLIILLGLVVSASAMFLLPFMLVLF